MKQRFYGIRLLAAVLAATRGWSPAIGVVATYGFYGALHASTLAVTLPALTALMAGLRFNREKMRAAASDDMLLATAVADAIAAKGTPFREAHEMVSRNLDSLHQLAKEHGVTLQALLAKKSAMGGTSPERVREAAQKALEALVIPSREDGEESGRVAR